MKTANANMQANINRTSRGRDAIRSILALALFAALASSVANAGHWVAAPIYPGSGAGVAILRSDGGIMVEEMTGPASEGGTATGNWYALYPDINGNYDTGTWLSLNSFPAGYGPLYFGSAVLPDGRILFEGGEYNLGSGAIDTNLGAIYGLDGKWTKVKAPSGWKKIGDAPTVVLPNGTFMMGDCCSVSEALFNPSTLKWTSTGSGKADSNSEEGWTLLPNGKVLTIDTQNGQESELYDPATGTWSLAGKTKFPLAYNCGNPKIVPEIGPAVLRPDGTVFATGANGYTGIYNSKTGKWSNGPVFPPNSAGLGQDGVADGPAALMNNGHVLVMTSNINPCNVPPADFYEWDGTSINPVPGPPNASNEVSFDGRMVEMPTGHILLTDGTQDVEIYYPDGGPKSSWAPAITSFPSSVSFAATYTIKGTQFNGLSQGAAYGDDAQSASNYPIIRITNDATGHVFYTFASNFSTMGVATGKTTVSADFQVFAVEKGPSTLVVVANGIPSKPKKITVK